MIKWWVVLKSIHVHEMGSSRMAGTVMVCYLFLVEDCCPAASALLPTGYHSSPRTGKPSWTCRYTNPKTCGWYATGPHMPECKTNAKHVFSQSGLASWGLGIYLVGCTCLNDAGKHTCKVHLRTWRFTWCQHIPGTRTPSMLLSGTQTSIFRSQQRQCHSVWAGRHWHHLGFPGEVGQKLQTESLLIPFRGTGSDTIREGHWWWCCLVTHIDTCSWQGKWRAVRCWNVLCVCVCVWLCVLIFPKLKKCPLATDRWLLLWIWSSPVVNWCRSRT